MKRTVLRITYSYDYYHDGFAVKSDVFEQPCCMDVRSIEQLIVILGGRERVELMVSSDAANEWKLQGGKS